MTGNFAFIATPESNYSFEKRMETRGCFPVTPFFQFCLCGWSVLGGGDQGHQASINVQKNKAFSVLGETNPGGFFGGIGTIRFWSLSCNYLPNSHYVQEGSGDRAPRVVVCRTTELLDLWNV